MNSTLAKVLRRSLFVTLLLLAVLIIAGSIFFSQLDLDDYRHELEQELSTALEQPVSIGRSKLTFNKGIALRFQDLHIGPEDALLAEVPYLTANLKIAPLLRGQIFLDRLMIEEPKFQVWFPINNRPEKGTTHDLTDQFGIRVLSIRDGSLKILHRNTNQSKEILHFQNLSIDLKGWETDQTATLLASGLIPKAGQLAEFEIDVTLPSSHEPEAWRNEKINSRVKILNLPINEQKNINFSAQISGIPAQSAQVDIALSNASNSQHFFNLAGKWQSSAEKESIDNLSGELQGIPLQGKLSLLRQDQLQHLSGRFGARDIKLTPQLLKNLHIADADKLRDGMLERLALVIEKSWPIGQPLEGLPRIITEFTLTDLEWEANGLKKINDFTADLTLDDQNLTISDGILVTAGQPFFFSGQVSQLFTSPELSLNIELHAWLDSLQEQINLPNGWKLSGYMPANFTISGPLNNSEFKLNADLNEISARYNDLLKKTSAHPGRLQLSGRIGDEQIDLEQLELKLGRSTITGNGSFAYDPNSDFFLLDIDQFELATLHDLSPLLKQLRLKGKLHPRLERNDGKVATELHLNSVGTHLYNIVGDLNNTTGTIYIDNKGLSFRDLKASFGKSLLNLNGQLGDWAEPELNLSLTGHHVRAQDLIFPNRKLQLYNLDGKLLIDKNGINFQSVKVQLEKETEVEVTGTLDNFSNPQVTLDIEAEKANVDQVIQLFVGPRKRPEAKPRADAKPLIITARIKEGTIGELRFKEAEGLIKDHQQVFTIYPLNFLSGEGFCQARVEFDRNRQGGLLKVSGHAEGINATVLHKDLFKDRGLINGTTSSNFYVEGNLANNAFWPNALGGIHLQVKDGTLRKFRGLARVFSLLNVSQLFTGKLPDMDKDGMPFTLLEGSIQIANGRAKTEDLKIISEAMNMSLVGSQSLLDDQVDYNLGVMPLRTVDKVITAIPVAGWVLAGEDKALLTAHFKIEGSSKSPKVSVIPASTVSKTVFGIFKRTLGLPGKLVEDIGSLFKQAPKKKEEQ